MQLCYTVHLSQVASLYSLARLAITVIRELTLGPLSLSYRDTSLIWTYSQVGRKCCFHSQSTTPRSRCNAGDNSYSWLNRFSVHNDETRKRERGIERLGKRQATMPHRLVKKCLGYSRRSGESTQYPALRKWPRNLAIFYS